MSSTADLFEDYALGEAWDEMISADRTARAPYRMLHESLQRSGGGELRAGVDALARAYLNQGVTFDVGGEERPFPLDIVPRVIDDESWSTIEAGVQQRVHALEAFLADVYGSNLRCPTVSCPAASSRRRVISTGPHTASNPRTGFASTSAASI